MNLASIPLIFVGGGIGFAARNLMGLAVPMGFLQFSRSFESEADFLGIEYMYKAGYDPQALTAFFEKVKALEKHKPGTIAKAFNTHPQTPDRIQKTQQEINTLLPPEPEYIVDTSEFVDVRARLFEIQNRHAPSEGRPGNRPTLRRAPHTPDNDNSGTASDPGDDRPKLSRRGNPQPSD